LRRQDPNESEEDFPINQDQVNQGSQDTRVAEAEGAANERTQDRSTRAYAEEQVQDEIVNEAAEDQENQKPKPNKNNRRVGYRAEGVHTRSKTKKAAMVSIEEDLCFFMGQEDPKTYSQAMKSDKSEEWSKAIKDEIESLERLGTWE
jgi:hypothetical protein